MVQFVGLFFAPLQTLNLSTKIFISKFRSNFYVRTTKIYSSYRKIPSMSLKNKSDSQKENVVNFSLYPIVVLSVFFGFFFFQKTGLIKNSSRFPVHAQTFYKKPLMTKIKTVPVFSVTNRYGQPFLIQNKNGEHVGLIFFSHLEALEFGRELEKSHQATNPRIFIMGLDKAMKMVGQGATSSGIKDKFGQDIKMRFQFIPDQKQLDYAINLSKMQGLNQSQPSIPIFTIPGLNIVKGKEKISPMFFAKEDLETTWQILRSNNPDFERQPEIIEGDFIKLIFYMKNNSGFINSLLNFGFVPSSESISFVKKEMKAEPSARMIF